MPPVVVGRVAMAIAVGVLVGACTESVSLSELPLEACVDDLQAVREAEALPTACSCATSTSSETWTVASSGGSCTLTAPASPVCVKSTVTGGFELACNYPNGAPACASLRFTRPAGNPSLVGLVVSDPVCLSSPAAPSTGSTIATKIQIPDWDDPALRVNYQAWDTSGGGAGCSIDIITSQDGPTKRRANETPTD